MSFDSPKWTQVAQSAFAFRTDLGSRKLLALITPIALSVAGCASYDGSPKPISVYTVDANNKPQITIVQDNCPSDQSVTDFIAGAGQSASETKSQWRDRIIEDCIGRVDSNYAAFTLALHKESVRANLGFGLTGLALTGLGAVASKSTANALSAASTGLAGASTEINKDLFYQKTIPAIIAQMDANREAALTDIITHEKSDSTAQIYTLSVAQHDIRRYEDAGSIDNAISAITAAAQKSSTDAAATNSALQMVSVVDAPTEAFQVKVANCVHAISVSARSDLDAVDTALGLTPDPNDSFSTERGKVLLALSGVSGADAISKAAGKLQSTKCPGA
jgi:hypothetical protein